MASAKRVSREAFDELCRLIQHWNENRLELFEISLPNENLEFEGIMRFYFQNEGTIKGSEKVATKCIRVSNTFSTDMVIKALVQKFRPDMRMLTNQASYALYEVHANQDERKLDSSEHPLLVQLGWSRDDRDGRFLLRSEAVTKSSLFTKPERKAQKRRLSKRVKKSKKDKERDIKQTSTEVARDEEDGVNASGHIARSLYNIMPESRFTRSISIKNRRNLLMRNSPDKFRNTNTEEESANEMKVYADFILPDVPSKSLLVSSKDTASQVVKSALDKYGIHEDATKFCLVQLTVPTSFNKGSEPHLNVEYNERIIGDNEHPHHIHAEWVAGRTQGGVSGSTMVQLQLRRRSSLLHNQRESHSRSKSPEDDPTVPSLVEIFQGAQSPPQSPRRFELSLEQTEIGSNVALLDPKSYICLTSGGIKPRHCVISSVNDIFTISPLDKTALIFVNGKYIKEPTFLPHNAEIKLGDREMFRFFAPVGNKLYTSSMHTLPSNIGRPSSSREMTSSTRQERKTSLPRSDNMSKAYSVEDVCSPGFNFGRMGGMDGRLKDRAFSEHNLKIDDRSSSGYGSGRVQRKFSEPNFMSEEQEGAYLGGMKSKYGGSDSHFGTFPSSNKKRHFSAPARGGDKSHLDEGEESEWVLPASLSFYQAQENVLLQNMITEVNGYLLSFKLAPSFGLYMVVKHHLSTEFQPSLSSSSERRKCLLLTIKNIIIQFKKSIKESKAIAGALAFWMANSSELLHFIKNDYQLSPYATECETSLTQVIHTAYKYFTSCMLRELGMFLPAFYDDSVEADSEEGYISGGESTTSTGTGKEPDVVLVNRSPLSRQASTTGMYWSVAGSKVRRRGRPTIGDVLMTLSSTVSLLKRCRVNATLSIMIFSVLFRYISTKLFNKLIAEGKLCTRAVGQKMKRRLERVKEWAEKEGMELPAEDHLCMIVQAATLLQSVNGLPEDAQTVSATCSKLNSLQVRTIIHHCSISDVELTINQGFVDQLNLLAQAHVDDKYHSDGVELNLEENSNLELPFLVPQKGYASDVVRGIPPGLHEYLDPMISSGLCKLTVNKEDDLKGMWVPPLREDALSPTFSGRPMSNFTSPPNSRTHLQSGDPVVQNRLAAVPTTLQEVVIIHVNIQKDQHSLGLSIIGGKNSAMHGDIGIFVKSMVEGGAAHRDGRIQPGDQILAVDNFKLDGCMQEEAAQILRATGKLVNLTVAKQTAGLFGLSYLITQASPRYNRKLDRVNEGSSFARKAMRKQRREQRERYSHERQQQLQQREFRLERRKGTFDHHPTKGQDHLHSYSVVSHNQQPSDPRFPPHASPQFTKWIMEQNHLYYSDVGPTGSELDLRSSMSSLPNIPERDYPPDSPELSFSKHYQYDVGDRSYLRPGTPPVRDPSPPKPVEHQSSSYTNNEKLGSSIALDSHTTSEVPSKFSDYTRADVDSRPNSAVVSRVHTSSGPYKDGFSSLSSQMTVESQQMLTPFSQQQTPSQHQQQHLDKLSMDVMQHTQLSGTSFQGITSLIPRLSDKQQTGSKTGEPHLDHKGLKEFEMDDIALEKQRIHLMFYEQQRQKELLEKNQLLAQNSKSDAQQSNDETESIEDQNEPLPAAQLRQELESLEEMVSVQRKKYREIKFSREREELKLKNIEMQFRDQELSSGTFLLNDQKRWQTDQKRMLRELERLKNEQNETIQKIQYSERRAKTKLKAYEAQASEIRQQLQSIQLSPKAPSPTPGTGYDYDTVPSKLPSEYNRKRHSTSKACPESGRDQSTAPNWKWKDASTRKYNGGIPARAMSIESMSTAMFEPPDLAREPMNTISASCLTEPTQDEPRVGNWSSYKSTARPYTTDLYSNDSHITLDTEQDELFELDQGSKPTRLNETIQATSMSSLVTTDSITSTNKVKDSVVYSEPRPDPVRLGHVTNDSHMYSEPRSDSARRGPSFKHRRQAGNGGQSDKNGHLTSGLSEDRSSPTKATIYAVPEFNETVVSTYDVPSSARAHQQTTFTHIQPTGHHYSRNSRYRGVQYSKVNVQPTGHFEIAKKNVQSEESPRRDTTRGGHAPDSTLPAPDVVPTSYSSPLSPHNSNSANPSSSNTRQVTGSERNASPGGKNSPLAITTQPSVYNVTPDSHYAVPPSRNIQERAHLSSHTPSPTPQVNAAGSPKQDPSSFKYHQHHNQAGSKIRTETNAYDQAKHHTAATRTPLPSSKPAVVYDVPTPAQPRSTAQRTSPYEGVTVRQMDVHTSNHAQPTSASVNRVGALNKDTTSTTTTNPLATKPKPSSGTHGHRYGIVKPGMGHSYSRGRPDPMQQPVGLDKVKGYMDRAYKNQNVRHPERIQRQQTEL